MAATIASPSQKFTLELQENPEPGQLKAAEFALTLCIVGHRSPVGLPSHRILLVAGHLPDSAMLFASGPCPPSFLIYFLTCAESQSDCVQELNIRLMERIRMRLGLV